MIIESKIWFCIFSLFVYEINLSKANAPYVSLDKRETNLTNIKLNSFLILSGICLISFYITNVPCEFKAGIKIFSYSLKEQSINLNSYSVDAYSIKFCIG